MIDLRLKSINRHGELLLAVAVFIVLLAVTHFAVETERDRLEQRERARVQQRLSTLIARVDAELSANVFLANGLVAYITAAGDKFEDRLEVALSAIYKSGRHLRNIGIAPGNRITHVYPLKGNEAAIGLYYPDVPSQWPAVQATIDSGTTALAGPVNLKQGGVGLISRTPVTLEDGRYWGMLSLVLDAEAVWAAVGLSSEVNGIRYAVRGKDGLGASGPIFLGDAELFEMDSVQQVMTIPGGKWVVAAYPSKGWRQSQEHLLFLEGTAILALFFVAVGVYGYQRIRTQAIENEKRLRTFLDTTRESVIVIDQTGKIHEFNAAAEELFGYSQEEVLGQSVNSLMPPTDAAEHNGYLRKASKVAAHIMAGERRVMARRKDGREVPIEVSVGMTKIGNRRFHVGLVRDVTERQAFEAKLIELATTDSLTHLLNRRAFLEAAENAFKLSKRHCHPLSVLMIDADHFKRINDTYGHQTGDAVLVRLAAVCQEFFRTTDELARFGGEEFIALLPETGLDKAEDVAERFLSKVREIEVDADNGQKVRFTVSVGVSAISDFDSSVEEIIKRADSALYDAKKQGRDRCVIAPPPA